MFIWNMRINLVKCHHIVRALFKVRELIINLQRACARGLQYSLCLSVCQSVSLPVSQFVSQSVSQFVSQSVNLSVSQSFNSPFILFYVYF